MIFGYVCIYNTENFYAISPRLHIVINFQEKCHRLCRELDRARRNQQRLYDVLFEDIRNLSLITTQHECHNMERGQEHTLRTLMPALRSPSAWRLRSSVTIAIGLRPAFSASVVGITSSASAYAWKQYASMPVRP